MHSKSQLSPFRSTLLSEKTAMVTGAGKGIGRACAVGLVQSGAQVIAVARTQSDLNSLHEELGENLIPMVADAMSDEFYAKLEGMTNLDVLVNNLGINKPQPFVDVALETYDAMLDVNVRALFRATQIVARNMLDRKIAGSIINISSQMGHIGSPGRSVYCLTKHAVEGLTKAIAVELAPSGIRANCVAPTFIDTPMVRPMLENEAFHDFVMNMIPMKKIGQPGDVANAVVYLASRASDMVTGTSLRVDGGWTAQ